MYRTTACTSIGETPFRLAYGHKAIIAAEVVLTSYRVSHHDGGRNEEGMHIQLDLLNEVKVTIEQRIARYQGLMEKHYNNKVRPCHFQVGDLVLKKVIRTTRRPLQGKLCPNWEGPYKIIDCRKKGTYHLETLDGQRLHHPWNTEHLRKYYQ